VLPYSAFPLEGRTDKQRKIYALDCLEEMFSDVISAAYQIFANFTNNNVNKYLIAIHVITH